MKTENENLACACGKDITERFSAGARRGVTIDTCARCDDARGDDNEFEREDSFYDED